MSPNKGSRRCFLCDYRHDPKNAHIMLHSFPSCKDVKKKWMEVCELLPTENVANVWICSKHFQPEEYYKPYSFSKKYRLNEGAIPSRRVVNETGAGFLNRFDVPSTSCNQTVAAEVLVYSEAGQTSETNINLQHSSSFNEGFTEVEVYPETGETSGITIDLLQSTSLNESVTENECPTPKRRRFAEPRYINEISPSHFKSPKRTKRVIDMVKQHNKKQGAKIKQLQDSKRLLLKKVKTLEDMVVHLKQKNLLSEQAGEHMLHLLPDSMQEIVKKQLKGNRQYSEKIRSFAFTVHFYSPRAYSYIRSVWKNLLPHPSTIKQWYRVINGAPGFTAEALNVIKLKVAEKKTFINICIDEMSIREQLVYNNGRFYGGIEFGSSDSFDMDNVPLAKNALVFMAVPINDHWKIPVGYFLISGLSGKERSALLVQCIELINETGATVHSVTFDGAPSNLTMCSELGACYDINNLKPYFNIPNISNNIYTIFDVCHMIKLVRNTIGDKKCLKHKDTFIKWEFIERLVKLQNEEGLRLANKLTTKHVKFDNHRMKVNIACQTLSASVSKSLIFLCNSGYDLFKYSQPTAEFCQIFNDIMDLLNCKNRFSKSGYNIPINVQNMMYLQNFAKSAEEYIKELRIDNCPILKSRRKIGFLGIIVDLNIIFNLFKDLNNNGLQYLLTYKINNDYLETFFSAIRARGGFNNNPNSFQFQSAYKRLLLRVELKHIETGNCLADGIDILHVSSKHVKETIEIEEVEEICRIQSHDYLKTAWTLSHYVENVVSYMAGYVVSKLLKTLCCEQCVKCLTSTNEKYEFIELKRYSDKFITPSKDVVMICRETEKTVRENSSQINVKNADMYINNKVLYNVQAAFSNEAMIDHIKSQGILDNHRILLIKKIVSTFLKARLHWIGTKVSQKDEYVRQKYTKLVLFKNQ